MAETKNDRQPPSEPPKVGVAFAGDEVEELAARIADLQPREAADLLRYLKPFVVPIPEQH